MDRKSFFNRQIFFLVSWFMLTALAVLVDPAVADLSRQRFVKQIVRPVLKFVDYMGGYSIHVLVLAVMIGFTRKKRVIVEYITLMVSANLLCTLLKYSIGRARPGVGLGHLYFSPFSAPGTAMNSFPSGDATAAMALATWLGLCFPRAKWAFWIIGAWASLARVALSRHYLSDVVFGAGLGIFCVLAGSTLFHRRLWRLDDTGIGVEG